MLIPNPAYVERLKDIINSSNFPSHLSMTLEDIGLGFATFKMRIQDKHMQPYGIVHGGNLATLVDSAAFWALYFSLEDESAGLTSVDLKLNYLNSVTGGELIAHGTQIKLGKTLGYSVAEVRDDRGAIVAHGTSTLMILPKKGLSSRFKLPKKFLPSAKP